MWTYECPASTVILFSHTLCCLSAVSLTVLDYIIGIRLDAFKKILRLGALGVTLTDWWRTILTYVVHARCFQVKSLVWQVL